MITLLLGLCSATSITFDLGAVWGATRYNALAIGLNARRIGLSYVLGIIIGTQYCNGRDD